jgi:Carboxypeptidase regulatory-like domain/TonB dependent receptor
MNNRSSLRQVVMALVLLVAFLSQGTWALAGTTGGLSGQVTGDNGAPVAGAAVKVSSPSQTASTTTDASGHFNFLSLAPDSYALTATKDGYAPSSYPGVVIFADQSLTLQVSLQRQPKTIASVTSRSNGSLVKPGTTADVYSVSGATQTAVSGIGGGYNLDSSYSAIYSQPGVNSQIGNYGFGQVYYIRGSSYSQVGYEYDGVPVNRAFDNYNANSLSNVGAQETEVYTGGSPAGGSAATLGGYINQVIKTGTFPGYANGNLGLGTPAFYHKAGIEAGGATPDRLFSYYVGLQGSDETYNTGDNCNLCGQPIDGSGPNGIFSSDFNPFAGVFTQYTQGPYSTCNGKTPTSAMANFQGLPTCNEYAPWQGSGFLGLPLMTSDRENVVNVHFGIPHHNDSGKDDIQILYYDFSYHQNFGGFINQQGGLNYLNSNLSGWGGPNGLAATDFGAAGYNGENGPYSNLCGYNAALFGPSACATTGGSPLRYADGTIFSPGTTFGQNAAGAASNPYYAPSTQTGRAIGSGISPTATDTTWNDGSVVKIQYQKNIGSSAYVRVMGYSFYSDWLMNSPNFAGQFVTGYGYLSTGADYPSPDYELATHSRGIQIMAADQINSSNLIQFTGNYTTATANRWNNEWYAAPTGVTNLVGANGQCYTAAGTTGGPAAGTLSNCLLSSTAGGYSNPSGPFTKGSSACANLPGSPACAAGAQFEVTVPGAYGTINQVKPQFASLALQDEWRPTDRWDINLGVRFESYVYDLQNSDTPENAFWFAQAANAYCYDPKTHQPILQVLPPGSPPSEAGPVIAPNSQFGVAGLNPALCYATNGAGKVIALSAPSGVQAVHPNGLDGNGLYTNLGPNQFSHPLWSPRIGGTYTFNPDTVVRFNYGRYTQPTETAFEQYLNVSGQGAAKFDFTHFWGLGFDNPDHDNPVQVSNNYDISLEKHLKGTDWTFKLSPFYRYTTNQLVTVALGGSFASGINAATQQTKGVELAIQKGDPSRNGFSGQLNYTYTNASIKYSTLANGTNAIDIINNYILAFNGLTKAGGGSPYYCAPGPHGAGAGPGGTNTPSKTASCQPGFTAIANPYYGYSEGGTLDRNGWYPTYANAPPQSAPDTVTDSALSPNVFAGFINWKKDRFTATVNGVLNQGTSYGSPLDVVGLDPRTCARNQIGIPGVPVNEQLYANYQSCNASSAVTSGYLAIPNPQTASFNGLASMREPWQLNLGLQFGYDATPRIHLSATLANILNTCFGGSPEPWTAAYHPNSIVCAYAPNGYSYVGGQPGAGFFLGSSGRSVANGTAGYPNVFNQSYQPLIGALPFQVYFNAQVRL